MLPLADAQPGPEPEPEPRARRHPAGLGRRGHRGHSWLLNSLTPLVSVTMTNVTTDDFLVASDTLQANDLNITSG